MVKLADVSGKQVRDRELVFLQSFIVAISAQLSQRHLLVRESVIPHQCHFQSRVVAFDFYEDHFIEDEITYNGCTWVNWHSFPQIEVLLLLIVEVLVVAVDYAEFERLNTRGRKAARIVL